MRTHECVCMDLVHTCAGTASYRNRKQNRFPNGFVTDLHYRFRLFDTYSAFVYVVMIFETTENADLTTNYMYENRIQH